MPEVLTALVFGLHVVAHQLVAFVFLGPPTMRAVEGEGPPYATFTPEDSLH